MTQTRNYTDGQKEPLELFGCWISLYFHLCFLCQRADLLLTLGIFTSLNKDEDFEEVYLRTLQVWDIGSQ